MANRPSPNAQKKNPMSISAVVEALDSVELGSFQSFRNLTVFPLYARTLREADYVTLDEALARKWVHITEVGEGGSVPELSLVNIGPSPVLLLDGEELIGAKQNRVLNLTILVAAQSTLVIPVSCVESGRWRHVSRHFTAASRTQFAEGRAAKMRNVTASLMHSGTRRSNQGEVWQVIAEKSARVGAESDTHAMSAMFEKLEPAVDDFVRAFASDARQVGAIFAINGRVAGLDLFDAASTWRKLAPKLVRSYAVDAIDRTGAAGELHADDARRFMTAVASGPTAEFAATGVGTDVRVSAADVAAAALVADGRTVHLGAFAN